MLMAFNMGNKKTGDSLEQPVFSFLPMIHLLYI